MWTDLLTCLWSAILKNIPVQIHHDGEVLNWAYHGRKEVNVYFSSFQKSLRDSLEAPEIMMTDFAKFDRPGQLHIAYQALHEFVKQKGCLPKPRNQVCTCALPLPSPGQLHITYQALHEFVKQKGCLPKPRNQVCTCTLPLPSPGQLHIAYQALHEFVKQKGCLPKPRNQVCTCTSPSPSPRTVIHRLPRTDICPNKPSESYQRWVATPIDQT